MNTLPRPRSGVNDEKRRMIQHLQKHAITFAVRPRGPLRLRALHVAKIKNAFEILRWQCLRQKWMSE